MPSSIFSGSWSIRRLQATVLNDIWPEVTFFTLIAMMVTLINKKDVYDLTAPNGLLSILGTVLGLVISFRTSTAYERYSEGRKLWATIQITSRGLAQNIWNHVSTDRDSSNKPAPGGATDDEAQTRTVQALIEKKTMINLIHAYAVSVKHLLRGEPGVYYEDLYPLVCFLPRFAAAPGAKVSEADMMPLWHASELTMSPTETKRPILSRDVTTTSLPQLASGSGSGTAPHSRSHSRAGTLQEKAGWFNSRRNTKLFDPEAVLPVFDADRPLKPAQNPPETHLWEYLPFLRLFRAISRMVKGAFSRGYTERKRSQLSHQKFISHVESNVPLEICLYLSSYQSWLLAKGLLMPAIAAGITANLNSLQDSATSLQRIRNTPLPFAYQAHLRMSLYLYLLYFPFAIYATFGWWTIAAVAFTSFLFLGFLEIGAEIENPFEYDENDLDLDGFCLSIQRELNEVTAHHTPQPSEYLFTAWNQPFAPADRRNAEEILRDVNHDYHIKADGTRAMQRTLLRSWREVNKATDEHWVSGADGVTQG
jgi:putative membrane protein